MATRVWLFVAVVAMTTVAMVTAVGTGAAGRCSPGDQCWPSYQDFATFATSLDGDALFPFDANYSKMLLMHNVRTNRVPYVTVVAKTVQDVQKSVRFATQHNMKISVYSSGHDYIGRSTADNSVQINLSQMKEVTFNLNSTRSAAGEMSAGSGNGWRHVYEEVDKINRVVVGGSAPTLSMGGYTLGGGHSSICRKYGLAADNLLEVEMVTADGSIVVANDQGTRITDIHGSTTTNTNSDLFWALRGGGGGTFGVVTKFTFKLHLPPKAFVMLNCGYPMYVTGQNTGKPFLETFNNLLASTLAPEWGGYQIYSGAAIPNATDSKGSVYLFMNHAGEYGTDSFNTIQPFLAQYGSTACQIHNVSTFLEYERNTPAARGAPVYNYYIFNSLIQPDSFTDAFYNWAFAMGLNHTGGGCTGTMVGGNMGKVPAGSTAVTPHLRSADLSLTCAVGWTDPAAEDQHVREAEQLSEELLAFGRGTFFNEPSAHLPNWKIDYWGSQSNYDKLLRIKQAWDLQNVFTCHHCVGSDLGTAGVSGGMVG